MRQLDCLFLEVYGNYLECNFVSLILIFNYLGLGIIFDMLDNFIIDVWKISYNLSNKM